LFNIFLSTAALNQIVLDNTVAYVQKTGFLLFAEKVERFLMKDSTRSKYRKVLLLLLLLLLFFLFL